MLTLPEELVLLGLRPKDGAFPYLVGQAFEFGLPAAALLELILEGRLRAFGLGQLELFNSAPTGVEFLDEIAARVRQSKRTRDMSFWIRSIGRGGVKNLKDRLLRQLVQRGILREEASRHLLALTRRRYLRLDSLLEQQMRGRITAALLGGSTPDGRTAALISLLRVCRLVDEVFPESERDHARMRIDDLQKGKVELSGVPRSFGHLCAEAELAVTAAIASTVNV